MANIPPKLFYRLDKDEQWKYATSKMRELYDLGDQWKKISQEVKKCRIEEPAEIDRPDEDLLKNG